MAIKRKEPTDLTDSKWLETDQYFDANNVVNTTDEGEHLELEEGVALEFDGTDSVSVSNSSSLNITGEIKFEFWLKKTGGTTSEWKGIISKGGTANTGYTVSLNPDNLLALRIQSSWIFSTFAPENNIWHKYEIRLYNDNGWKVNFLIDDGKTKDETINAIELNTTNTDVLYLGRHTWVSSDRLVGKLKDVKIYDGSTLAAHWKLDEGTGTTAGDSAGENDGTISGATWVTGYDFPSGLGNGYRVSKPLSLDSIKKVKNSNIKWTSTKPTNTDIKIYTAISSSNTTEPGFFLSGWDYRKKITIDHTKIDDTLTDFPVLVKLTSSNFDFTKANSDGFDIRFTDSDGITLLKYERERHDSTNGKAEYWVKIPSISSSVDTDFYIYYRTADTDDGSDKTNVWNSNFKGVWHLKEDPSGTAPQIKDSTSNNDGTTYGSMTSGDQVEGKIDGSLDFDGSDDYINIGNFNGLNGASKFTISFWLYSHQATFSLHRGIIGIGGDSGNNTRVPWIWGDQNKNSLRCQYDTTTGRFSTSSQAVSQNTWEHWTIKWSGSEVWFIKNGTSIGTKVSTTGTLKNSDGYNYIGLIKGFGRIDGLLDEIRISDNEDSSAWTSASYNSESDNLISIGSAETAPTENYNNYTEATSNSTIPGISTNQDLTGKYLWIRQKLSTTIDDTPTLSTLEVLIETAKKSLAFFKFF